MNFENLRYEGFGPKKVAIIVEALTDNKNRTASNIRTIFQKNVNVNLNLNCCYRIRTIPIPLLRVFKLFVSYENLLS